MRAALAGPARGLAMAVSCFAACCGAHAQTTFNWINRSGGSFHDAGNWSPRGGPPGAVDTALFDLAGAGYAIDLAADASLGFLIVRDDIVLLDLNARTLAIVGDYPTVRLGDVAGSSAAVAIADGLVQSPWTIVGEAAGAQGQLVIGRDAAWHNSEGTHVGIGGDGAITVNGGEYLTTFAVTALDPTTIGQITVRGGSFTCAGPGGALNVGGQGRGALTIADGGAVACEWSDIAGVGSASSALITGNESRWSASLFVTVGFYGDGSLSIEDGGLVTVPTISIGDQVTAAGSAVVSGAGSRLHLESLDNPAEGSHLVIGRFGQGDLVIDDGASVDVVAEPLAFNPGTVSIGQFSSSSDNALIVQSSGTLDASGPVQVGVFPASAGILSITGGGVVTSHAAASMGGAAGIIGLGGQGSAFITCDPSLWNCANGSLDIGSQAGSSGSLAVSHGAGVESAGGFIGRNEGSTGTVLIYGVGDCGNGPVSSHWTSSGTITIGNEGTGTLTVGSGAVVAAPLIEIGTNGSVLGNSVLQGDVVNAGLVSPGLPIGQLSIEGSYVQTSSGRLTMEIGAFEPGQYDTLVGDFNVIDLAGTLEIALVNGFAPAGGEEIIIIAGGFMLNNFEEVASPSPVVITPNETFAVLQFIPGNEYADLTGDGEVNGGDLGQLLLAFGPCPPPGEPSKGPPTGRSISETCLADFNDDSVVDGADLGMLLLSWNG
jgi:T5SS/PEP-CTERM-associated repeat protein